MTGIEIKDPLVFVFSSYLVVLDDGITEGIG